MRSLIGSLAVAAVALCCAGPAFALPGDPPVAPIAPADGGSLPTASPVIPVSYACPRIRLAPDGSFVGAAARSGRRSAYAGGCAAGG